MKSDAAPALAARRQGNGEPIVLLHGFPGSSTDWGAVALRLAETHSVVVPDLLGFGASPRPERFDDLWVDAQAHALAHTLDELDVGRATLVGHDYGGPVALAFARARPDRVAALALAATNVFADTPVPLPLAAVRWPLLGGGAARLLFSASSLALLGRRASRGARPARNDAGEARTIRTIFTRVLRDLPTLYAPLEQELSRVRVPRLVVWGDSDPIFPLAQGRRTAEALGAELVILEGAGHFLPVERPVELAAAILGLAAPATAG